LRNFQVILLVGEEQERERERDAETDTGSMNKDLPAKATDLDFKVASPRVSFLVGLGGPWLVWISSIFKGFEERLIPSASSISSLAATT
jgi:hypothetical protein